MPQMTTATIMVDQAGRLVIPARLRQALGVESGGELMLVFEDNRLQLFSKALARSSARQAVKQLVPPGVSLADELSADRAQEAV